MSKPSAVQALRRRCGAVFGVGAAGREGAQRIAHFPSRDARAEGRHGARGLEARQVRRAWRWRIEAGALGDVGAVHAGGRDLDQDLAVLGCGTGRVVGTSAFGPARPS